MSYKKTIQMVLIISIAGVLFSGYLSYYEMFSPNGCEDAIMSCGLKENSITVADLPACVYGFFMYAIVLALCIFSLVKNRKTRVEN